MADLSARRLVALLGHLTNGARIPIAELAERVGATEATLASDLLTLSVCGVAPYYPDDLMPLIVEDGFVTVFGELPALSGSIRLSGPEARALASALQAAGFSAEDELPSRLLRAAASATFDAEALAHTIRTADATHDSDVYQTLAGALAGHDVVRIDYVRAGTEAPGAREVEPVALFAERGAWYVTGWCRSAGDWRTFRVDRIRAAQATSECFEPGVHGDSPAGGSAFPAIDLPVAVLRFAAGETFDEREWPGGRALRQTDDGSIEVEVPFGGTEWMARHVVARLGGVEAVAPESVRAAVATLAAAELARV